VQIVYDRGIHLPEIGLWMDSRAPREACLISHAHADHLGRHARVIATHATSRLCGHRQGARPTLALPFGEPRDMGGYTLTLHPAGHCLGSAQALVEYRGERLVYTGDFKLRESRTSEPPVVLECDTLVMDVTFGEPPYLFPSLDEVTGMLCDEIETARAEGAVPVVVGYSLGKGQEALALLVERGYDVAVHPTTHAVVEIYRECGVRFEGPGSFGRLASGEAIGDRVLLVPPGALKQPLVRNLARKRTIYLTGWAMGGAARYRYGVDAIVPLSDHAGYDDLLRYVEQSGARRVVTLYGSPNFAKTLRREAGIEACHMGRGATVAATQMTLF
jgi:Cft2 family RNA processing exonuclease